MGKVRMADIAKEAGVSTVTVHNALANQKGVSDEMRLKIQEIADRMGYQSSRMAMKKNPGRRLWNIVAIISERYLAEYTTYYWKIYQELALIASDKSCLVAAEILKHDSEDRLILPRVVEESSMDGIIVIGEIEREYVRFLKENAEVPVVFLDVYDSELAEDAVIVDNFYGTYLLTSYLLEHGFRKIAYVGSIHATSSIMDRYCGFYKALLERHLVLPEEWRMEDRDSMGNIQISLPKELPEAFVCNCDLTAGHLILALEERGLRVPEDISVVGFDNYLYPGFPDKKITSYEVNTHIMAKVALEKVLKKIRNPEARKGLDIISGRIVEKESVMVRENLEFSDSL